MNNNIINNNKLPMESNERRSDSFSNDINANIDSEQRNSENKLSEGLVKPKEKFCLFKSWENEGKNVIITSKMSSL